MKAILAALFAVALTSSAFAKKSAVDFTPFEGTYTGNYFLTVSGMSYFSTITFKVAVPKSGKTLTVTPSGILFVSGSAYPFGGSLVLGPGKKAQLLSVVFLPSALPTFGTGSFSGKKNSFSVTILSSFGGTMLPTIGKLTFTKKGLTLDLVTSLGGSSYAATITAKKKK